MAILINKGKVFITIKGVVNYLNGMKMYLLNNIIQFLGYKRCKICNKFIKQRFGMDYTDICSDNCLNIEKEQILLKQKNCKKHTFTHVGLEWYESSNNKGEHFGLHYCTKCGLQKMIKIKYISLCDNPNCNCYKELVR